MFSFWPTVISRVFLPILADLGNNLISAGFWLEDFLTLGYLNPRFFPEIWQDASKYSTISRISFSKFSLGISPGFWCSQSASELKSSVESVKMEEVRLLVEDKNAEAALKSSSRSETVSRELPMERVEVVESCMESQSSTEKNPDSQLPRRFHICIEAISEFSWK